MTAGVIERAERGGIPWWVVLLQGIALVILGILFLTNPGMTTVVAIQFLGIYWMIIGIFSLVSMFVDSSRWGWKLISGILGIIAGIIILQHPIWSPLVVGSVLVIVLGIQGIIVGLIQLIHAFKGAGWGVGLLGVLSIIIGIILLANIWAFTLALPLVIGIFALIGGVLAIIGAFQIK
jgi:uncharacterized membrane protein HdeD (DUF308 family)